MGARKKWSKVQDMVTWWQGLQDVQGPCAREWYEVYPQAQANIPCHGTLGQKKFYLKPQAQAHSFHGLFGT